MKYRFTSAALAELRQATLYYEQRENGLGTEVLSALAHVVKHFAFTRRGELNVFGMVDLQIIVLERELFA